MTQPIETPGNRLLDWRMWALVVGTLLVYAEVRHYEFVNFDDDVHVYLNPHVTTGLTWQNTQWAFAIHGPSQWHPLAWLSHQLDCQLFDLNAGRHHATNLMLHLVSVVLLYLALNRLCPRPNAALFVAAMFAVHPLNVESVAWVSERRNVLCGVFWMCALLAYTAYARRGGLVRYAVLAAACAAALMAKPMAVTLPCVLLLLDYWPLCRFREDAEVESIDSHSAGRTVSVSGAVVEKLPLFALAAASSWLSFRCQRSINVVWPFDQLSLVDRVVNAVVSYGIYLRRMVLPTDLAVLYPHPILSGAATRAELLAPAAVALGVVVGVSIVAWRLRKSRPAMLVGWLWFLGTLVPMIGLVQVGEQQLADRYVYLPMIGLGIAVAYSVPLDIFSPAGRIARAIAVVAVFGWAGLAWFQLGFWTDSSTLFTRTVLVTDQNSRARLNLGLALYQRGEVDAAIQQYLEALEIDQEFGLAWYNLGVLYHDTARSAPALECFTRAVECDPDRSAFRLRLGAVLAQTGDAPGALREFEYAAKLAPESEMAWINLGLMQAALGETEASIASYRRAVEISPTSHKARRLLNSALSRGSDGRVLQE